MAFFNPVDPDRKVNTVNPVNKPPSPPPYYSSLINDRQSNRESREHQGPVARSMVSVNQRLIP